jgi:hypothetical protein
MGAAPMRNPKGRSGRQTKSRASRSSSAEGLVAGQRKTDPAAIPRASESVAPARLVTLRLSLLSWGRNCWPQGQSHKPSPPWREKRPAFASCFARLLLRRRIRFGRSFAALARLRDIHELVAGTLQHYRRRTCVDHALATRLTGPRSARSAKPSRDSASATGRDLSAGQVLRIPWRPARQRRRHSRQPHAATLNTPSRGAPPSPGARRASSYRARWRYSQRGMLPPF